METALNNKTDTEKATQLFRIELLTNFDIFFANTNIHLSKDARFRLVLSRHPDGRTLTADSSQQRSDSLVSWKISSFINRTLSILTRNIPADDHEAQ